jgi:hypothetical protein
MGRKQNGRGPQYITYFWPLIQALRKLGGSARPAEAREEIAKKLRISDAVRAETLPSGIPRFYSDVSWAKLYLVKAGIIYSSSRGVWTLTDKGRTLTRLSQEEALAIFKRLNSGFNANRRRNVAEQRGGRGGRGGIRWRSELSRERIEFLKQVYKSTDGDTTQGCLIREIGDKAGVDSRSAERISKYLIRFRCLDAIDKYTVRLTSERRQYVEDLSSR